VGLTGGLGHLATASLNRVTIDAYGSEPDDEPDEGREGHSPSLPLCGGSGCAEYNRWVSYTRSLAWTPDVAVRAAKIQVATRMP